MALLSRETQLSEPGGFIGLRAIHSPIDGHPHPQVGFPFADAATGSLGQGLSVGAGLGAAAQMDKINRNIYVIIGDGESREGQIWEAVMAASHYKLGNLVAIVDANGFSGSGPTSQAMNIEPLGTRFAAFGWLVREIDGHAVPALMQTFDTLPGVGSEQPVCVIARTRKGHGAEMFEKQPQAWHLGLLTPDQQADVVAEITTRMELAGAGAGTEGSAP